MSNGTSEIAENPKDKLVEAQSTFASTLLTDAEKTNPTVVANQGKRHGNFVCNPIDTTPTYGIDPVYAAKAQLLNEAMLDIGMGRYQWFMLTTTSVGWFLDQVSSKKFHQHPMWALIFRRPLSS